MYLLSGLNYLEGQIVYCERIGFFPQRPARTVVPTGLIKPLKDIAEPETSG